MSSRKIGVAVVLIILLAGLGYAGVGYWQGDSLESEDVPVASVRKRSLRITLLEKGTLKPYNFDKIKVDTEEVNEFQVEEVVSNGATVEKGEVLLRLDDSEIKDKIKDTRQKLEAARNDLLYAKEEKKKEVLNAKLNIRDAKYKLELARKNLKKFINMEHEQNLEEKKMAVKRAQVEIDEKQEELEAAKKMKQKALISQAKLDKARVALEKAQFELEKAKMELRIYKNHTYPIRKTELQNDVKSKKEQLESQKSFFEAVKSQKTSDVQDARSKKKNIEEKLQQLKEDREKLLVEAPSSGIVNYGSPDPRRFRRRDTKLKEGETVRAGRILMYIPDLNNMYAHVPVNETDISKLLKTEKSGESSGQDAQQINLKELDRKTVMTAFRKAGRSAMKELAKKVDLKALQQSGFSAVKDLDKQEQKALKSFLQSHLDLRSRRFKRLDATVTSESFPNAEMTGEVDYVAGAASEEGFWSDVKKFDTRIKLNQHYDWYRPGINVKVEILIDETDDVLTVPVEAIFSREDELFCYRRTASGHFERIPVQTDRSNGRFVEITDGNLAVNDQVALSEPDEAELVQ